MIITKKEFLEKLPLCWIVDLPDDMNPYRYLYTDDKGQATIIDNKGRYDWSNYEDLVFDYDKKF
jgi:hypothetical protein